MKYNTKIESLKIPVWYSVTWTIWHIVLMKQGEINAEAEA